jgi:hypothetical protein
MAASSSREAAMAIGVGIGAVVVVVEAKGEFGEIQGSLSSHDGRSGSGDWRLRSL